MAHRIVVALGGNALKTSNKDDVEAQKRVAAATAKQLVALAADGHEVIVSHGNGPQVGAILLNEESSDTPAPLDTCSAMSQGEIGYWLQQAIHNELTKHSIEHSVATIITQTLVDAHDPAFKEPSKPIGPFYPDKETAGKAAKKNGFVVKEDAGRGWRRVVASPKPKNIIEKEFIMHAVERGNIVISAGGGGVPVVEKGGKLVGVEAVIDKDFAAATLAHLVGANRLLVLTAVETVSINYQKPDEQPLRAATEKQMRDYIADGQFAPGSMLPKIEASLEFIGKDAARQAIITTPGNALAAVQGKAGTVITVH